MADFSPPPLLIFQLLLRKTSSSCSRGCVPAAGGSRGRAGLYLYGPSSFKQSIPLHRFFQFGNVMKTLK